MHLYANCEFPENRKQYVEFCKVSSEMNFFGQNGVPQDSILR